jgi:transposase-like protein
MMPLNIAKSAATANAIEDFHRQVGKVTKTKGGFTNDMVLLKLVYMATKNFE